MLLINLSANSLPFVRLFILGLTSLAGLLSWLEIVIDIKLLLSGSDFLKLTHKLNEVVLGMVKILHLDQQSQYLKYLSIANASKSTMPDLNLLISTNKIVSLSLALSHHCYQSLCGLYDFV